MNEEERRPMLPRIRRGWDARQGCWVWECNDLPRGAWGLGVSQQARYDWRQAQIWCAQANAAERSQS
jgi:hypothetical protein